MDADDATRPGGSHGPAGAPRGRRVSCGLVPQQNASRMLLELGGLWDFQLDPACAGEADDWPRRLPRPELIGVPGSWNEQFQDTRDYTGVAWYQTRTTLPRAWQGQRIVLRIGSAVYHARVWVDGHDVGEHSGGHLPFAFDVTDAVVWDGPTTISIRVENDARPTRVPPAGYSVPGRAVNFPDTNYDFFPYSGLHRAVTLYAVPDTHITDISVIPAFDGADGLLQLRVTASGRYDGAGSAHAAGNTVALSFTAGEASATLRIADVRAWCPADPHLYSLTVCIGDTSAPTDVYTLDVGVRTIEVRGDRLLLNGEPILLRGPPATRISRSTDAASTCRSPCATCNLSNGSAATRSVRRTTPTPRKPCVSPTARGCW